MNIEQIKLLFEIGLVTRLSKEECKTVMNHIDELEKTIAKCEALAIELATALEINQQDK